MDDFDRDLFGEPVTPPSPVWERALARANLIEMLASIRLMARLSAVVRGDSASAGHGILLDGLPALFAIGLDHDLRKPFAAFAGLKDDPMLDSLSGPRPGEDEINEAVKRLAAEMAPRWRAALEMLEAGGRAHE